MSSPIEFLVPRLASAVTWLAPEKGSELLDIVDERKVSIKVGKGQHWYEADTNFGQIRLHLDFLERIWAFCFGYLKIWRLRQERRWPAGELVQLTELPELTKAREMLRWATTDHQEFFKTTGPRIPREGREEWPADFPTPEYEDNDSDVKAANTFFLSVCAFIILHEVGHTILEHTKTEEGIGERSAKSGMEIEYEADDFAANFLLSDWRKDPRANMFIQRAVAIVTGLSLATSLEPYRLIGNARSHPCTPDRFLNFWIKFGVKELTTGVPIGAVVDAFHLILGLHALNAAKGEPPAPELGAKYESIEDYLRSVRPIFGCSSYDS